MNYIAWALIGMTGYSFVALLVKLATRDGRFPAFLVLAIATVIVAIAAVAITTLRGDLKSLTPRDFTTRSAWFAYASGVALTVAVSSLFRALSLGPASIVVPIYGMFIVGGAALGIIFLGEPVTARKLIGIGLAAVSVYLIAGRSAGK
jgi:transporter family protein